MKIFKKNLIMIVFLILVLVIFGVVDYTRAKNDKKPIFVFKVKDVVVKEDFIAKEYYGLGYMIVICDKFCSDKVTFMPLYLGGYAWFKGVEDGIEVINKEECDNKSELYHSLENINIYTYCLEDVTVNKDNETFTLKEYLEKDSNAINYIIDNFTKSKEASYDDGGSQLYLGETFNILKCHTLMGNEDVYIGTKDMGYFNSFCK